MSLPKYIINFDELEDQLKKDLLKVIDDAMKGKYPQLNTGNLESLLSQIEDLLPDEKYKGLKNKIEQFILGKYTGTQKIQGAFIDVPAIVGDYKQNFIFDKDVYLSGLHLNQTGWKKEDRYSLKIDKNIIIDNATTKETGEHKYFNTYAHVIRDGSVYFILHNNSGNSGQIMVDLEYIECNLMPIVHEYPDPEEPQNPSIPAEEGQDIPIVIPAGGTNRIGYVDITNDIDELIIESDFSTITGASWPDLNLVYVGEIGTKTFGYQCMYCNSAFPIEENNLSVCSNATYTGWQADIERFIIKNPKKGNWYIEGRGAGSKSDSEVTIKVNKNWKLTNIQV